MEMEGDGGHAFSLFFLSHRSHTAQGASHTSPSARASRRDAQAAPAGQQAFRN